MKAIRQEAKDRCNALGAEQASVFEQANEEDWEIREVGSVLSRIDGEQTKMRAIDLAAQNAGCGWVK